MNIYTQKASIQSRWSSHYTMTKLNGTRREHKSTKTKGKKSRQNDRALYKTAEIKCKNFIMEDIDETWYNELEDSYTFYTNATALKLLDHITKFCSGIHTVDAVDIPQLIETLSTCADGIPLFTNELEVAQRSPSRPN